jgi:GTP-binding protein
MSNPIVAIVGRPNVGKSTLVNRLAETNEAIVHSMRGVTRDRSYHTTDWNGRAFTVVDTGGIEMGSDDAFQANITAAALDATREADVVLFVVDGRVGEQADDAEVARVLQRAKVPVFLVVNKMDNVAMEESLWEFYSLGLGEPYPVSALHGNGTGDLLDAVVAALPPKEAPAPAASTNDQGGEGAEGGEGGFDPDDAVDPDNALADAAAPYTDADTEPEVINVAIIGRPNAGKSSLMNCLTGQNRSIVSPVAGTTRDAVDTVIEHDGRTYRIVDTAGIRRKSKIDESVEYFSFVRAMRAIDRADVALLVVDGTLGITNEDQRVANYAAERGCALAILLNKWDIVEGPEAKQDIRDGVEENMQFVKYAPVLAICALSGKNVHRVWDTIDTCFAHYTQKLPTSRLNAWMSQIHETGHTVTQGKTVLRIKYVTQTGVRPPAFTFFCNRPDVVTDNYERFLENRLRTGFDLTGTPVHFRFKKKD